MTDFTFYINGDPEQKLEFSPKRILNGGFIGRNQEQVKKHIQELAKLGVPAPKETPVFYPLLPDKLTTSREMEVVGTGNSGEVEFVLLYTAGGLFVGVGSDHTDRDLEKASILKSKQVYPNIICPDVWRYDDLIDHWDELEMRSWLGSAKEILYQEGTLAQLMRPEDLRERAESLIAGELQGTVLFSGTLATLEELKFNEYFHIELLDRKRNRKLSYSYQVQPLKWFKGELEG